MQNPSEQSGPAGAIGEDGPALSIPPTSSPLVQGMAVWFAAAAVLALFVVGTWVSYWADHRTDQYQLIQVGQWVYHGGTVYVDAWENKPPGIAWINALGYVLGRGDPFFAWVLPGLFGLGAVMLFWLGLLRTLSVPTACAGALLASMVFTLRLYDAASINPDYYSGVLALGACSLWLMAAASPSRTGRWGTALLAGLLWAAAALVKQTGVLGLLSVTLVTVVGLLVTRKNMTWVVVCVLSWIGFAMGVAGAGYVLWRSNVMQQAIDAVFFFNTSLMSGERFSGLAHAWPRIQQWWGPLALPLWLALVGTLATWRVGRARRVASVAITVLVVWWAGETVFALLGPSRSMRYAQATFPAMLWLAAVGMFHVEEMLRRPEKGRRMAPALLIITIAVLLGRPLGERLVDGVATSVVARDTLPTERDNLRALGAQIKVLVPDENARIYVWGYDSGVYVYADRLSASPYTYPRSAQQMDAILTTLEAGDAAVLLVPTRSSHHFDLWCDKECRERLRGALAGYEKQVNIAGYGIFTLRKRPNLSDTE